MSEQRPFRPHDPPPDADRLLVILSDIEMGAGGAIDDFPHSDWLGQLICSYNEPPFAALDVDLVLNGDIFDLLKTSYLGAWPRHITGEVAVGKMARVAGAHPGFFEGVRRFLDHEDAQRRVFFIAGNHDPELLYPDVQLMIRSKLGRYERVIFSGFSLEAGRVHIEHGSQMDPFFRMERRRPFIEFRGKTVLNISWGAVALLDTVIPMQSTMGFHDRIQPREAVFDLMPEIRELMVGTFWRYYTRDYWKGYLSEGDPTKKLSWSMVKELIWRFRTRNVEVTIDRTLENRLKQDDSIRLYVVGHQHQPGWRSHGDRKILYAGCLRNEYLVVDGGRALRPVPRSYVEAYCREGVPIRSHLVEIEGPPAPAGYVPDSIFDVLPEVRQRLALFHEARSEKEARREVERREAADEKGAGADRWRGR